MGTNTCNAHTEIFHNYYVYCCIDVLYEYDIILMFWFTVAFYEYIILILWYDDSIMMFNDFIMMIWCLCWFDYCLDCFDDWTTDLWCTVNCDELLDRNADDIFVLWYIELRYTELLNCWITDEIKQWTIDKMYWTDTTDEIIRVNWHFHLRHAEMHMMWRLLMFIVYDVMIFYWVYVMSWYSDIDISNR